MKKFGLLIFISSFVGILNAQTLFFQDFSTSNVLANYIGTGIQQFDDIVGNNGGIVSISNNALVLTRSTTGSAWYSKVTDISSNTINGLVFVFDISVSGNTAAQTTAASLNVGNGYSTGGSITNSTTFAKIGINFTATDGTFALRDITNSLNSTSFAGTQTITWVLNSYTSSFTYLAPDNSTENIAANTWDAWVGTTKVFDDRTPQTSTIDNLTDFKFLFTGGSATLTFDNFNLEGGDGELPVELTSFSAAVIGKDVKLSWNTATEVNNYGFEVERASLSASPLRVWEKIGFINGNGNSNSPKSYSYDDKNVTAGKYSYRLKQIDNDGQFEYSKSIEVNFGAPKKFELSQNYPNPFNPVTTISFNLPEAGNVKLTLFNILGQELKTLVNDFKESGVHTINFDASELNSGMYIYKLEAGSFVQTRKMTLVK